MNIQWLTIGQATAKVIVIGLVFGAGLPILFSIGMRLWDIGEGGEHADGTVTKGRPVALAVGYALFGVALCAVLYGVLFIAKSTIHHYLGVTLPIG